MTFRVVVILLVALLLRLSWGLTRPASDAALAALPDQVEYLTLGRSLLHGDGLVFLDKRFNSLAFAYRTPGYPAFVAACGGVPMVIRGVQAVVDAGTVWAVFLLARLRWPREAWVAALLAALCPFLIYFSGLLLTETLFTAMVVWGMYLMLRSGGTGWFVAGVVVLALSILVRPGAVGLPVVAAFIAAMARDRLPRVPVMLTAVVATALVLLPWAWRNHQVLNEWIWTSTNEGITAYDGFNPAADGSSNQAAFVPHLRHLALLTETQRNHHLADLAAEWREENPGRAVELAGIKALRTWSPVPLATENQSLVTVAAGALYCGVCWFLAALGLMKIRGMRGFKASMLVVAVYLTLGATLTVGSLRYRVPAEPFLCVLATGGCSWAVRMRKLPLTEVTAEEGAGPL